MEVAIVGLSFLLLIAYSLNQAVNEMEKKIKL
jgi:hypothetical protein